jgi:DNA mismatch repair protein MSH4
MNERVGVVNMHLKVDISQPDKMIMLYKIADGFVQESHYGLALARVVSLPPMVLDVAEDVARTLEAQTKAKKKSSRSFAIARKRKLVLGLREILLQAGESEMEGRVLGEYLARVQREFVRRMDGIEGDRGESSDEAGEEGEGQGSEEMSVKEDTTG